MANGNNGPGDPRPTKIDPAEMASALELMGISPDLMNAAVANAGDVYDQRNGEQPEFSEEDQRMLSVLQGQSEGLQQPIRAAAPIGPSLPGNPYAVNFSGLSGGLQNLAAGLANQGRMDELYGDPDKYEKRTQSALKKTNRAKELRTLADSMQSGDGAGLPSFSKVAVSEILADAQRLEEEAQKDISAAEASRGVLGKARDIEKQQKEAQEFKERRTDFIQDYGQTTYEGALSAQETADKQAAITDRAEYRQTQLNKRNKNEWSSRLKKASIEAKAVVEKAKISAGGGQDPENQWPVYADPKFIQKYLPEYREVMEERMSAIDAELIDPLTLKPRMSLRPEVREQLEQRSEALKAQDVILENIGLEAISYENLKDKGFTPADFEFSAPSDQQRETLDLLKRSGTPPELIEAYKFYNGIKLNMAPKPPDNASGKDSDSSNFGSTFSDKDGEDGVPESIRRAGTDDGSLKKKNSATSSSSGSKPINPNEK